MAVPLPLTSLPSDCRQFVLTLPYRQAVAATGLQRRAHATRGLLAGGGLLAALLLVPQFPVWLWLFPLAVVILVYRQAVAAARARFLAWDLATKTWLPAFELAFRFYLRQAQQQRQARLLLLGLAVLAGFGYLFTRPPLATGFGASCLLLAVILWAWGHRQPATWLAFVERAYLAGWQQDELPPFTLALLQNSQHAGRLARQQAQAVPPSTWQVRAWLATQRML